VANPGAMDRLPFSAVKEHQLNALEAAGSEDGFLYKIADMGYDQKPFDMFFLRNAYDFIVVKYKTFFVLILRQDFVDESKRSKARSLSAEKAKEIAWRIVHIGKVNKTL